MQDRNAQQVQRQQVPGIPQQRIFSSYDHEEVEKWVNEAIVDLYKKKYQLTSISHLSMGEKKIVAIISFIAPASEILSGIKDAEVTEL